MTFLQSEWGKMMSYTPTQDKYDDMPIPLAPGKWKSYNSAKEDLCFIGKFIEIRRPLVVLECGTFEGRGTEYLVKKMIKHSPGNKERKLMTLDAGGCIQHISTDTVKFGYEEGWDEVEIIRESRLNLLSRIEGFNFEFYKGLTRDWLHHLLLNNDIDFIYSDASHLPNLLEQEWRIIENASKKEGLIICFDDIKVSQTENNPFMDWVIERSSSSWSFFYNDKERGQLWCEYTGENK